MLCDATKSIRKTYPFTNANYPRHHQAYAKNIRKASASERIFTIFSIIAELPSLVKGFEKIFSENKKFSEKPRENACFSQGDVI